MTASLQKQSLIYAVAELNQMVGLALSESFPPLHVVGEISNFSCPKSGHWYFSLKDEKAQVRCVFFQGKYRFNGDCLTDGVQVVLKARIRLYEIKGEFQLVVEEIERFGDGVLQQQFDALKQRLANEGLFDSTRKRALPSFISTVGCITSPTGAAICDVLSILNRRFPAMEVIIYPTLVQGTEAADQIVRQFKLANERLECQVLVLTRGGGSLEDLWPFNEEKVARAIAESRLPVVSAIGHEIDITIADFVSDIRASTPSAAAELISPDQVNWKYRLAQLAQDLFSSINRRLDDYQQRLITLERCLRHPEQRLQSITQQIDEWERRLQRAVEQQLLSKRQTLLNLGHSLEMVNPLATLKRGYALATRYHDGTVLEAAEKVSLNEAIVVRLAKGRLLCEVKKQL